jgi:hypothetical protein
VRLSEHSIDELRTLLRTEHDLELTVEEAHEASRAIIRFTAVKQQRTKDLPTTGISNDRKASQEQGLRNSPRVA